MKITKIMRKRRAVSPVIAVILLIGLAVAAAAVMFVVVLPMIAGPGVQISIDANSFGFTDTDSNKIYEKAKVPIMNTGSVDVSVTSVKVQTSSDDGTTWNDAARTSGLTVPISIISGQSAVPEFTFVPDYNDFLVSGDVKYRVVVNYKPEGEDTTTALNSGVETKAQDGLTSTMADIDAGYYSEYTIGAATINYCPRDDNSTAVTNRANVITVSITNNWDCDLVIDKSFGAYSGWDNGLYASTDPTYPMHPPAPAGRRIYALAFPGNSFDEAFCDNTNDYDYYATTTDNEFWTLTLGQTGTVGGTYFANSLDGKTINPGESVTIHYIGLGSGYTCIDGTTYYFAVRFHDVEFRWSEQVNVATGSYS